MTSPATDLVRGPSRRHRSVAVVPVVALAAIVLAACSGGGAATTVATAPVERATISTGASAAGSLAASESVNLGFANGGQLTSVNVHVGDRVKAGQVLATVDDFLLGQLLVQQRANLSQQEAVLGRLTRNPAVKGAKTTLSQARAIARATKAQVAAVRRADDVTITRSNAGLSAAEDALSAAEAALSAAQSACASPPCLEVVMAQSSVASAGLAVQNAQTAVATSEQKRKVDLAAGQVSIDAAQQGVIAAQNNESSLASDRPYNLQQQRAAVSLATSLVAIAQRNLSRATLKAPFDGVVTSVNGAVGEYLSPSNATTAVAPGSDVAIPGTAGSATSAITRPGGTQFLTLSATGAWRAVVPFSEFDAATILSGQAAKVTFDALPDLTLNGTVTAVAPSATALSGAMSFYATIRIDGADERLKEGLTTRVTVDSAERKDVLSVPNAAVHQQDGRSVVVVLGADGQQRTVVIQTGLVGAERTEILSGLAEGDRVVVPATQG